MPSKYSVSYLFKKDIKFYKLVSSKWSTEISITGNLMATSFLFFLLSVTISNNGWAHEEVLPFSPERYSKIMLGIS